MDNIRIFTGDARIFLSKLPPATLQSLYLLFPDPWPKHRHHKRRFIQSDNIALIANCLVAGGMFRVASDNLAYIVWTLNHMNKTNDFTAVPITNFHQARHDYPPTRYEEKAMQKGYMPFYLNFIRKSRA